MNLHLKKTFLFHWLYKVPKNSVRFSQKEKNIYVALAEALIFYISETFGNIYLE